MSMSISEAILLSPTDARVISQPRFVNRHLPCRGYQRPTWLLFSRQIEISFKFLVLRVGSSAS